jgi:hypothetical protein
MRRHKKGVALFLVLMITFVLTMLVGAFFGVNQSNFAALAATYRRKEAMLAAETGLSFVKFQLEKDSTWANGNIPAFNLAMTSNCIVSAPGGGQTIKGTYDDGRVFLTTVQNRLEKAALPDFPADAVKVTSIGASGPFNVTLSVVLKGEPIYDSAASTNGKIAMQGTDDWEVKSTDTIRNWVRANDDISTPDVLNPAIPPAVTPKMQFSSASSIKGVLWSRKDIYSGTTLVDASKSQAMSLATNGIVAPHSTVNYNLYDLQLTDLKVPGSVNLVNVPPGRYVVTESTAVPIDSVPDKVMGITVGHHNVDQPPQAIRALTYYPQDGSPAQVWYPASELTRVQGSAGVHPPLNGTAVGGAVDLGGFSYDFGVQKFNFDGNKQFQVNGDFTTGYEAPPTGARMASVNPDIVFSSTGGGSSPPTFVNVTGNFKVTGTVTGRGALATGGNISFMADANLTAATTDPLVLYAGNNVTIDASTKNNVQFTGLVYARNQFTLKSSTKIDEIKITGSLVARNGGIQMDAAKKATLTYDPAYLQQLTKGLPNGRRRLSQMSWHIR